MLNDDKQRKHYFSGFQLGRWMNLNFMDDCETLQRLIIEDILRKQAYENIVVKSGLNIFSLHKITDLHSKAIQCIAQSAFVSFGC